MNREESERREFTPGEKVQWVSRYRKSGLGLQRFAREHNLRHQQLHYWIYGKPKQPRRLPSATAPAPVRWAELVPERPWMAELSLPSGSTLRLSAALPPAWVAELVRSLRSPC
jgi:transposase-like protein